jgi:hypothetical protein
MMLSIDVGIKNLAKCVIDSDKKIRYWEVSGVPPLHKDGLFKCMKLHLDERKEHFEHVKTVVIEKQPNKNAGMKSIEHFIHAYFLVHGKEVVIYDARHKIPDITGPSNYKKRKNAAVERCREFIKENNEEWVDFFDKHKKKDDLADTVMQALAYMNTEDKVEPTNKPRKPTENQKLTKYSKANLAYIVKNGLEQDDRFHRDLNKYYKSIDELIMEFKLV